MPTWAWLLVVAYLWIAGGLGWVYQHESRKKVTFTKLGRVMVVLLSPFLTLVSAVLFLVNKK